MMKQLLVVSALVFAFGSAFAGDKCMKDGKADDTLKTKEACEGGGGKWEAKGKKAEKKGGKKAEADSGW